MKNIFKPKETKNQNFYQAYFEDLADPIWTNREYADFAKEAYMRNVVANRAINMIAHSAANIDFVIIENLTSKKKRQTDTHPLLDLLKHPNPMSGGAEFFENIYSTRMISGNAYMQIVKNNNITELYNIRPDRMRVITGKKTLPIAYQFESGKIKKNFYVDPFTGKSEILHLKTFHPLNDLYGMSQVEAAAYSIDQHNQAAKWNQSLLQNSARPSGALVYRSAHDISLTATQFERLKEQVNESFCGNRNAGKPLLLENNLTWQEMSMTPKEMDFIEAKNSAARDIALAFGVPPQLLGLPGDNTYSNMQEARLALWEETILPLLDNMCDSLNNWLTPYFGDNIAISYDKDKISILSSRRENIWNKIENASFMTINEKRNMVGLPPIDNGDVLVS